MIAPLENGLLFLIQITFDIFILILTLRLLFQATGVHFYNPIAQFVVKLTKPILYPLKKFIPMYKRFDLAVIVAIFLLDFIKFGLLIFIKFNTLPNPVGLLVWSCGDILNQFLNIFFFAILIGALLSWIGPKYQHPIYEVIAKLSAPILRPIQRIMPTISGIDISPIFAIILIKVFEIVIADMLIRLGASLSA